MLTVLQVGGRCGEVIRKVHVLEGIFLREGMALFFLFRISVAGDVLEAINLVQLGVPLSHLAQTTLRQLQR